jgi:nucleotide-binding universal stress UspA family protein
MRRIVIHLHAGSTETTPLSWAIGFSQRLNARLSVIFLWRSREYVPSPADGFPGVVYEHEPETAPEAAQIFRDMSARHPFVSFAEAEIESVDMITRNGFVHDLTIVERLTEREGSRVADFNTAVFGTGGPVLVTPPTAVATIAERPAVVWNSTVPSARAIRSAIPLLRLAERTTILSSADNPDADPSALAGYLDCYGIRTERQTFKTDSLTGRARGRALLEAAAGVGADLLVMGAYGEGKITAMLGLGRATEKVVTSCRVPLLVQA